MDIACACPVGHTQCVARNRGRVAQLLAALGAAQPQRLQWPVITILLESLEHTTALHGLAMALTVAEQLVLAPWGQVMTERFAQLHPMRSADTVLRILKLDLLPRRRGQVGPLLVRVGWLEYARDARNHVVGDLVEEPHGVDGSVANWTGAHFEM
eukprot:4176619-Prymnesium_polylepis.1